MPYLNISSNFCHFETITDVQNFSRKHSTCTSIMVRTLILNVQLLWPATWPTTVFIPELVCVMTCDMLDCQLRMTSPTLHNHQLHVTCAHQLCQFLFTSHPRRSWSDAFISIKGKNVMVRIWQFAVCNRNHHTATENHMPYGITQCYLPSSSDDFPAFTPAKAGTRFSNLEGMQGWWL